jgi:hypothetical protein
MDNQALATLLQNFPQMSPADQQALIASFKAGGTGTRRHRAESGMPAEKTKLWNNYYSVVRFQADHDADLRRPAAAAVLLSHRRPHGGGGL